jgi:hypothetical protein
MVARILSTSLLLVLLASSWALGRNLGAPEEKTDLNNCRTQNYTKTCTLTVGPLILNVKRIEPSISIAFRLTPEATVQSGKFTVTIGGNPPTEFAPTKNETVSKLVEDFNQHVKDAHAELTADPSGGTTITVEPKEGVGRQDIHVSGSLDLKSESTVAAHTPNAVVILPPIVLEPLSPKFTPGTPNFLFSLTDESLRTVNDQNKVNSKEGQGSYVKEIHVFVRPADAPMVDLMKQSSWVLSGKAGAPFVVVIGDSADPICDTGSLPTVAKPCRWEFLLARRTVVGDHEGAGNPIMGMEVVRDGLRIYPQLLEDTGSRYSVNGTVLRTDISPEHFQPYAYTWRVDWYRSTENSCRRYPTSDSDSASLYLFPDRSSLRKNNKRFRTGLWWVGPKCLTQSH